MALRGKVKLNLATQNGELNVPTPVGATIQEFPGWVQVNNIGDKAAAAEPGLPTSDGVCDKVPPQGTELNL